jgi:putative phosphoserine phosphatase/1-acylglycerol-3-phosphate O-acyltransferase
VALKYRSLDADTRRIMKAITALLPDEAHVAYEPTEDELRRTFPPSYRGSLDGDVERRPGSD